MARGRDLSLEEARRNRQLAQFVKEHPSEGDVELFDRLLRTHVDGVKVVKPPNRRGPERSRTCRFRRYPLLTAPGRRLRRKPVARRPIAGSRPAMKLSAQN